MSSGGSMVEPNSGEKDRAAGGAGDGAPVRGSWVALQLCRLILRASRLVGFRARFCGGLQELLKRGAQPFHAAAEDGAQIAAVRIPGRLEVRQGMTVFLTHGWAEVKENHLREAFLFSEAGFDVILFDLRAHGRSTGKVSTFGVREHRDVSRLIDEAQRRGFAGQRVITVGFSMGAATMLMHAATDERVAGVVAYAPFVDLRNAIDGFRELWAPWVGQGWLWGGFERAVREAGFGMEEASALGAVGRIEVPVLFVVGDTDRHLPAGRHTHVLHAAKTVGWKGLIDVPAARHLSLCRRDWPGVDERVVGFMGEVGKESQKSEVGSQK